MTTEEERLALQAQMLANRLQKRFRHFSRLAKRDDTDAFRIYDRDIPEVPLAVDYYAGHLQIASFARGDDERDEWLSAMRAAAAAAIGVPIKNTALKRRERKKGHSQYERQGESGRRFVVTEGGHRFWVNLWDYLDTGLFLDHRTTRRLVAQESGGKRVLNLYCYTGSFGVYAQAAGAASLTQVDLSRPYLAWAEDNLKLNDLPAGELVQDDTLPFLARARAAGRRFDVAVVDPPTFSSSKRMEGTFDIKRDHGQLLQAVREVMSEGGVVWFATNARGFNLSEEAAGGYAVADMTEKTRAWDFEARHSHRAWRLVVS